MVPWWLAPETEQMDEWARQVPLPSSRHFCVVPLPRTRAELPQDVREPTEVPSVFPQTRPSSLLFPTRGRSCHLVSSLAFLAFFLPASPSSFTSASSHCFRLFTFHNPIHSEPGCCTRQPRIRVGCAPGLPWIRVLPKSLETTIPRMPRYPVTYWKIKSLPSAAGALCIC